MPLTGSLEVISAPFAPEDEKEADFLLDISIMPIMPMAVIAAEATAPPIPSPNDFSKNLNKLVKVFVKKAVMTEADEVEGEDE